MTTSATAKIPPTALATLTTDEPSARRIVALFAESFLDDEVAVSMAETAPKSWRVTVYFAAAPDQAALRALAEVAAGPEVAKALTFEELAAKDWVGESLAGLKPVAAGRFVVHGAHDRAVVPVNRIGVEIEAALAFGTGHHGTTRGCLVALDRVIKSFAGNEPKRILDLGTGSGVLAIAAARAWHRPVLATDIDADSVRVARENIVLNGTAPLIHAVKANGLAAPAIRAVAPYDLVFANILLGPLQRLAVSLGKAVAPGGSVILSGLLDAQANAALTAYRALRLERRISIDGWTTLLLRQPPRRRTVIAPRRRRS